MFYFLSLSFLVAALVADASASALILRNDLVERDVYRRTSLFADAEMTIINDWQNEIHVAVTDNHLMSDKFPGSTSIPAFETSTIVTIKESWVPLQSTFNIKFDSLNPQSVLNVGIGQLQSRTYAHQTAGAPGSTGAMLASGEPFSKDTTWNFFFFTGPGIIPPLVNSLIDANLAALRAYFAQTPAKLKLPIGDVSDFQINGIPNSIKCSYAAIKPTSSPKQYAVNAIMNINGRMSGTITTKHTGTNTYTIDLTDLSFLVQATLDMGDLSAPKITFNKMQFSLQKLGLSSSLTKAIEIIFPIVAKVLQVPTLVAGYINTKYNQDFINFANNALSSALPAMRKRASFNGIWKGFPDQPPTAKTGTDEGIWRSLGFPDVPVSAETSNPPVKPGPSLSFPPRRPCISTPGKLCLGLPPVRPTKRAPREFTGTSRYRNVKFPHPLPQAITAGSPRGSELDPEMDLTPKHKKRGLGPHSLWMSSADIQEKQMKDLKIPGTHDSATNALTMELSLIQYNEIKFLWGFDFQNPTPADGSFPFSKAPFHLGSVFGNYFLDRINHVSRAQDQTIRDQLYGGIRYFDLRIYYEPTSKQFFSQHGLKGSNAADIFSQVAEFMTKTSQKNSAELVMLSVSHTNFGQYPESIPLFQSLVDEKLGSIVYMPANSAGVKQFDFQSLKDLKLSDITDGTNKVMVLNTDNSKDWGFSDKIVNTAGYQAGGGKPGEEGLFSVSNVHTPEADDIIGNILEAVHGNPNWLLQQLALQTNAELPKFLEGQARGYNVVFADWYEDNANGSMPLVELVLGMNGIRA